MAETPESDASTNVLALGRDLMFSSRIAAEGRAAGVAVRIVRDPANLPPTARMLMVDLALEGAIDAAANWQRHSGRPVVAFVSHVDEQTIAKAKDAGIVNVMSRGSFTRQLPRILRDLAG
jgi:AmiR/NasT family two-component response regulator